MFRNSYYGRGGVCFAGQKTLRLDPPVAGSLGMESLPQKVQKDLPGFVGLQ